MLAAVKFIAHLVNQQVAHEIIALELLTVLLEKPTDDSVEVAVGFVKECGSILQDLSPKGLHGEYSLSLNYMLIMCLALLDINNDHHYLFFGFYSEYLLFSHTNPNFVFAS